MKAKSTIQEQIRRLTRIVKRKDFAFARGSQVASDQPQPLTDAEIAEIDTYLRPLSHMRRNFARLLVERAAGKREIKRLEKELHDLKSGLKRFCKIMEDNCEKRKAAEAEESEGE